MAHADVVLAGSCIEPDRGGAVGGTYDITIALHQRLARGHDGAWSGRIPQLQPHPIHDGIGTRGVAGGIASLTSGFADADERHRSLMMAFDESWRMLTDVERRAFSACSVFVGGFERSAALEIAGARSEILRRLARKLLVEIDHTGARFDMHPLLRQFGAAKLGDVPGGAEALARRHSAYFATFAARHCA